MAVHLQPPPGNFRVSNLDSPRTGAKIQKKLSISSNIGMCPLSRRVSLLLPPRVDGRRSAASPPPPPPLPPSLTRCLLISPCSASPPCPHAAIPQNVSARYNPQRRRSPPECRRQPPFLPTPLAALASSLRMAPTASSCAPSIPLAQQPSPKPTSSQTVAPPAVPLIRPRNSCCLMRVRRPASLGQRQPHPHLRLCESARPRT